MNYREVREIIDNCRPILAGRDPAMIGAALADLTAMLFAGHHPSIREAMIEAWVETMRKLVEPNEKMILEAYGGEWPTQQ